MFCSMGFLRVCVCVNGIEIGDASPLSERVRIKLPFLLVYQLNKGLIEAIDGGQ